MPKDYNSFCLVATHLIKNAHQYWNVQKPDEIKDSEESKMEQDFVSDCKDVNRKLRIIQTLKRQNRINEQQEVVTKLKEEEGSYRDIAKKSGISLKAVHLWCSIPKSHEHKATSRANLRKEEFTNFLMQDTVTFSHPCKRYANKRFLIDTWEQTYKRYLQQKEYQKYGTIGKSTMRSYKPKNIFLSGSTPLSQCLCDSCENCELMVKALVTAGLKGIPPNKYALVEMSMCESRTGQFGTSYSFPLHKCLSRECEECGRRKIKIMIEYMKLNLVPGYVLQVMDFAMNFRNWYQDEVQSAYWTGTQMTIHATINFFRCTRSNCNEIVTLALVHLTDDNDHDSFLSRVAQNMTFQYLVNAGVPLDLSIQFCDNCASQYKSRRPFAELARCALAIICVYFGEKHGKSHADALFGRLKSWMSYHIKTRNVIVKNAYDFFTYCKDHFQTPYLPDTCQHYRVEFEYIRPSNVRRSQDCDLDRHVPHTQNDYSVRNTPQPLELKFRQVPCLCPSCISEQGECMNKEHADSWKLVKLKPKRGDSKLKHQKRKRPDCHLVNLQVHHSQDADAEESDSDDLPDIQLPQNMINALMKKKANKKVTDHVTDTVTEAEIAAMSSKQQNLRQNNKCSWRGAEEINEEIGSRDDEDADEEVFPHLSKEL